MEYCPLRVRPQGSGIKHPGSTWETGIPGLWRGTLPDARVSRNLLGDGGAWGSEKQSFLAPNVTESNPAGLGVGPGLCVLHKCPRTVPTWGSLA